MGLNIGGYYLKFRMGISGSKPRYQSCIINGCDNLCPYGNLCKDHKCILDRCMSMRIHNTDQFCYFHKNENIDYGKNKDPSMVCAEEGCTLFAPKKFCFKHKCVFFDCLEPCISNNLCKNHMCAEEACTSHVVEKFCYKHKCAVVGCIEPCIYPKQCQNHTCKKQGCKQHTSYDFCLIHECGYHPCCHLEKEIDKQACPADTCEHESCNNKKIIKVNGSSFCEQHTCRYSAIDDCCYNYVTGENGKYCSFHLCIVEGCEHFKHKSDEYCDFHKYKNLNNQLYF